METINIKPAQANIKVRDPETFEFLSEKVEAKPRNAYWLARLRDGDVVVVESKLKGEK
ncbi:DUF2635 domain-containing protein [Pasteurella multocida]|uniref:DUF2635 domain-containing protein n=1 Tax=Pasteurella multocida TaxID=747 RepID=UPI000352B14E|nr:DUF2635 domain-containing protein [Pasteurella multocida]AWW56532.1 DUF2635 domain-containing protein [Pasteurella multocida]EPE67515.1 protein gp38 [Pasteurella multocida P1933]MCL7838046.1 DUF2635 domain-containing protein [Pasteurella multocida]MCL7843453.1 DUF2635 domain-containing protein [Pasteurella multocida]MDX3887964.1 DUF2635 domain-containing protein [Pasteurella multocida]